MGGPAEDAWRRYREVKPQFDEAGRQVTTTLRAVAAGAGLVASVSARSKDVGEFARKIVRKNYVEDPWRQVTDKLGARVLVERVSHIDAFIEAVGNCDEVTILRHEDGRDLDPQTLMYSGVHLQLELPQTLEGGEHVECELQVRTRAQDLWAATVSHRLLYKPSVELPAQLQRPLYRLLALVEVFDEEFDRAMDAAAQLPDLKVGALVDVAERQALLYLPTTGGDPKLTAEILPALASTIDVDPVVYAEQLAAFMKGKESGFATVLRDYGPGSGAEDFAYVLFGQPEIVILYERLVNAPSALQRAWQVAGLPSSLLESTANVLGAPIS